MIYIQFTSLIICFWQFSWFTHSSNVPRLLIISLDGFRHDYLNQYDLPTLNSFRNEGVQATNGMRPTFTTMTFPNHISIATGFEIIMNMNYLKS